MPRHQTHILDSIRELQRLADLFVVRREQLARSAGLTVPQWHVLEEISDEHFMPSMFARIRESSAAAVSRTIRQLIDRDLVTVEVSDVDGRMRTYRLTDPGRTLMARLRDHRSAAIEAVWGDLDQDELEAFRVFSERLSQRLERFAAMEGEGLAQRVDSDLPGSNSRKEPGSGGGPNPGRDHAPRKSIQNKKLNLAGVTTAAETADSSD